MSEFERLKVSAGETLMAKGRQVDHGRARVGWLGTCRLWLPCRRRWENGVKFKYSKFERGRGADRVRKCGRASFMW